MPASRTHSQYLYTKIANSIAELINEGTYRPGDRIPSVRQMSKHQDVSISTVLQAYLVLEKRGLIEARPQSGYYVLTAESDRLPELEPFAIGTEPTHVTRRRMVMKFANDARYPELIQLGVVMPNLEMLPIDRLNRILARLARQSGKKAHRYELPPGLEELRIQIAKRSLSFGCQFSPNDIVVTSGAVEAIDLCLRAVCKPGDIVAIESPMYFGSLQSLEVHGLRALEIPTHQHDGISLDALKFAIKHNPIKAVLVISNFNNPLGSCIPDEKKKELVELLTSHDIPLIENDESGEIYFTDKRPQVAKSYDTKGLVMLCSSFSNDISVGLRVGWVAPGRFQSEVEWLKFTTNVATATLPQMAVAEFLASGRYDRHLRQFRRKCASNVSLLSQAIARYFPPVTRISRPTGGNFLWLQLPESIDSCELYGLALQENITIAPGILFSPTDQFPNFIRLNAVAWSHSIERAVERLGELVEAMVKS